MLETLLISLYLEGTSSIFESFRLLAYVPSVYWVVISFFAGLVFGSFANVVIYRVPLKKSIVNPPSACPACGNKLAAVDLIPVLSWLFLRMRCRFCKDKISARYPAVELFCGLLFAAMTFFSPTLSAVALCIFVFVLMCVSFVDWDIQEIPDGLLILGGIVGVLWVVLAFFQPAILPLAPAWYDALLGIIAGALPLLVLDRIAILIWKKDGFGYGDVKLMAMVGIFMGWQLTLLAFLFAIFSSFPIALYLMIKRRIVAEEEFDGYMAFGPFLCAGSVLALWFGSWFVDVFVRFAL